MRGNPTAVRLGKTLPEPLSLTLLQQLRHREFRDQNGLYLAEGVRNLVSLIDYRRPLCGIVHIPKPRHPMAQILLRRARNSGVPTLTVTPDQLNQAAQTANPQGIVLIGEQWNTPLPKKVTRQDLWLGLDDVKTPGNVGTLLRSLEAAGGNRLLLLSHRLDPYDPKVIRATMGSLFAHEISETSAKQIKKWPNRHQLSFIGATGEAQTDYRKIHYKKPSVLLLGHERTGLTPGQLALCDRQVAIPMSGRIDSLNLAMAGTLILYEARNQRHPIKK